MIENLDDLTRVLQASISPVALVSGVGLLILSLTNRFGRVTDRLRELAAEQRAKDPTHARVPEQIEIFLQRAHLLRASIRFAVGCVLLSSIEVLLIFATAVLAVPFHLLVLVLFAFSLLCLITALLLFMADMRLSLQAVKAELRG